MEQLTMQFCPFSLTFSLSLSGDKFSSAPCYQIPSIHFLPLGRELNANIVQTVPTHTVAFTAEGYRFEISSFQCSFTFRSNCGSHSAL